MNRIANRRPSPRIWRTFSPRDGQEVEQSMQRGHPASCPLCGQVLEARPKSRLQRSLPLGAFGYDLDCRLCRRFWCVVRHSERSLRLMRMRRLVAAVRAVEITGPAPSRRTPAAPPLPTAAAV